MKIKKLWNINKTDFKFEIEGERSDDCNNIYIRDNNINADITEYENYKNLCTIKSNSQQEYNRKNFINICQKIYNSKNWSFKLTESKISNFINNWLINSNKFKIFHFLENPLKRRSFQYLRNYTYTQAYNKTKKKITKIEFFI